MKNNDTTTDQDYKNLVDCMAVYSEATARMAELEADLQQCWLDLVDARRKDYTTLQSTLTRAEEACRCASELHPEWFAKVKSIKTPYGTVAFRKSTKLEVPNEEVSIVLLEQLGQDGLPFIQTAKKLNLEALEKLSDEELKRLRITRYATENFKITAAKVDLGKAVKESAKS
jgi:hypothetical protein